MKRNHVAADLRQRKNMQILPHASYTHDGGKRQKNPKTPIRKETQRNGYQLVLPRCNRELEGKCQRKRTFLGGLLSEPNMELLL